MSATLSLHGRHRRRVVRDRSLDRVDLRGAHPGVGSASSARTASASRRLLAACAGALPVDSGEVESRLRQPRSDGCARSRSGRPRRCGRCSTGAPVSLPPSASSTRRPPRSAAGDSDAADRYDLALHRWLSLGAADLDARIGVTAAELGMSPIACSTSPTPPCRAGRRHASGLAALLLSQLRRVPARRADQRPRPRRARAARAWVLGIDAPVAARQPRSSIPRSGRHRRRRDRRVHSSRRRIRRWLAGVSRRARSGSPPRMGAVRGVRRPSADHSPTGPSSSASGRSRVRRRCVDR